MMGRKREAPKKDLSNAQDTYKERISDDFSYKLDDVNWYGLDKKEDKPETQNTNIVGRDVKISEQLPPEGREVPDIEDRMGYFETKTAGTILVGFDRYNSKSDLGFTVVAEKEKNREGIPEIEPEDPNTYFGGNFDGENRPFQAGPISFKYNKRTEDIEKIVRNKEENPLKDEENLLYQDKKEEEELKKLKKEKSENPDEISYLSKEEDNIKKIINRKREKNEDFLNEIKDFIINLKNGKIKKIIEAEEAAKRKRRILELSSKSEKDFWLMMYIKKMLKEMFAQYTDDTILAELFIMVKLRGLDIRDLERIVEDLKKEVYFK